MKYARTFFTKPYNDHKVEIRFGSGYQNVEILVDNKEVKKFKTAFQLLKPETISIPGSDDVLIIKFLRETVEFEVFFNGQQIDTSATSAKKVTKSIGWTFGVVIGWYAMVFITVMSMSGTYGTITRIPISAYFSDPGIIYAFTSTFLLLGFFIFGRIHLHKGNFIMYRICLILLVLDALYGVIYLMAMLNALDFSVGNFFALIIPGGVKGICIYSLFSNLNKYQEYCNEKNSVFYKGNDETLDL